MPARRELSRSLALLLAASPICFVGAMVTTEAHAENYALIAAASDYPNLLPKYWLKGPKNDAILVRDYLLNNAPVKFEPQNVTTLSSGDGMQLATHQNILDSLDRIASEAKAGDFVFLQFSGHGSQQPAVNDPDEPDGKDEVFLSADTEMAPADNPTFFPNVLTDNEMATKLAAIRKNGAFVWVVFDSCYSGSMTRAPADPDMVERKIDPADLGIPDSAFPKPGATATAAGDDTSRALPLPTSVYSDDPDNTKQGGLVAFFAAQTTETAPETPFSVQQPDGTVIKQNYGVFTHTIFTALANNPNLTYRQLAQTVLADYTADNWLKPTPVFQGRLDAPVFGSNDIKPTEQWPVKVETDGTLSVAAGQIYGVAAGTKLLVLPSPAAPSDQAIGVVEVKSADELNAVVIPSSDDKHPLIDASLIKPGTYVRVDAVQYPFELVVARPDPKTTDATQAKAVDDALDAIVAAEDKPAADPAKPPLRLKVVDPDQAADLRLAVLSQTDAAKLTGATGAQATALSQAPTLWLLPASGEISLDPTREAPQMPLPTAASADTSADFAKALQDNLVKVFRATGLSRLTAANSFAPSDFKLVYSKEDAGSTTRETLAPEQTPVMRPGDRLFLDFTNNSGKTADVNVLYVDHDYGITQVCKAKLAAGDHMLQPVADIDATDSGAERVVTVVNESDKNLTDLGFLAQPGITRSRGLGEPGLLGMIDDLGAGEATRAAPVMRSASQTPRGAVVVMPLDIEAATGATAVQKMGLADDPAWTGDCGNDT